MKPEISEEIKVQSKAECGFCLETVNALDLELTPIPLSNLFAWACDECRKEVKDSKNEK